MTTADMK